MNYNGIFKEQIEAFILEKEILDINIFEKKK